MHDCRENLCSTIFIYCIESTATQQRIKYLLLRPERATNICNCSCPDALQCTVFEAFAGFPVSSRVYLALLKHPSAVTDTLISPSGKILVPGIREAVAPLSDEEWRMYQDIQFDLDNYKNKIGLNQLMYSNKVNSCVLPTFLHAPLQIMKMIYINVMIVSTRWICWPTYGATLQCLFMALRGPSLILAQRLSSPPKLLPSFPSDRFPTWTLLWSKNRYIGKDFLLAQTGLFPTNCCDIIGLLVDF